MILSQLSSGKSSLATTDSNIYVLASILVWFIITTALLNSEEPFWVPYYGSWVITFLSETITFCFHLMPIHQTTSIERAQFILQIVRLILVVFLPVLTFAIPRIKRNGNHGDEEAAPLLGNSSISPEESQRATGTSKYGSTDTTNTADASPSTETDDSLDEDAKEEKEKREALEKRLRETGNWWTYISSFSVRGWNVPSVSISIRLVLTSCYFLLTRLTDLHSIHMAKRES
jgi:hypothetical protein